MPASRSGRLISGGSPVELVLFESSRGNSLDDGITTALISHLKSQCVPACMSLISLPDAVPDFSSLPHMSNTTLISADDDATSLWKRIGATIPESGIHLVVVDSFSELLMLISIRGFVRLLHAAREAATSSEARVVFAAVLHCDDFSEEESNSIKNLATSVVEVSQRASENVVSDGVGAEFHIWNDVVMHIRRLKPSGRVNVDVVVGKFDAEKCLLGEVVLQSEKEEGRSVKGTDDFVKKLNLPFNVSLSESERKSRAAVALPYVHRDTALADSALELHPKMLQVVGKSGTKDGCSEDSSPSDEDTLYDEDGEELFSEDV